MSCDIWIVCRKCQLMVCPPCESLALALMANSAYRKASLSCNLPCAQEGGHVVVDPWQSNAFKNHLIENPGKASQLETVRKSCITVQDVLKERAAFTALHGLID